MKKIACVFLALLTLIPCLAFADGLDYGSMTADELRAVIMDARAALAELEEPFTDKCVVYDENDIKVTITGIDKESYAEWYNLYVTVVNKSDNMITVIFDNNCINGWQVKSGFFSVSEVAPKKNAKDDLNFLSLAEEADVSKLEDIEDYTFTIRIYDPVNYKTLYTSDEQTITFSW